MLHFFYNPSCDPKKVSQLHLIIKQVGWMIGKSHGTSNVLFRIVAFRIPRNYTDNSISFHKIPIFRCIFESHFRVFRMKFAHLFICTENKTLNIGGILFRVTMQPLMKFPMKLKWWNFRVTREISFWILLTQIKLGLQFVGKV